MANPNMRYSDTPVEIGMLRFVSDKAGGICAHIITDTLPRIDFFDVEYQSKSVSYPYLVRLATPDEEAEYRSVAEASNWMHAAKTCRF